MNPIFLDNNSTTPCDPRVVLAISNSLTQFYGNPASATHIFGWQAEAQVQIARENLARLVNCEPSNIIFTSGATEAINLALVGLSHLPKIHYISSNIEHKAVLDTLAHIKTQRLACSTISVDNMGKIDLGDLERSLQNDYMNLVSIIHANNEIGTVQDLDLLLELKAQYDFVLHLDAAQSLGKIPLDLVKQKIDLISFSAHKMYGPKGVGALYVSPSLHGELQPLIRGGGHERGFRSGTLNVPGIVGLGKAAEIGLAEFETALKSISSLSDLLLNGLNELLPGITLNGDPVHRLPGNLNLTLPGIRADALLAKLASRVAISSSSACTSETKSPSYVLKAIGLSDEAARRTIRIGVGKLNTEAEISLALEHFSTTLAEINS